jgi:hypothetical protein
MSQEDAHTMVLIETHPSGVDEWVCPICGRRLLMSWSPTYNKIVLSPGDDQAIHNASKGGLTLNPLVTINPDPDDASDLQNPAAPLDDTEFSLPVSPLEAGTSDADDLRGLTPWLEWMNRVDFDDLWNRPVQ